MTFLGFVAGLAGDAEAEIGAPVMVRNHTTVLYVCIRRVYASARTIIRVGHREQLLEGAKRCLRDRGIAQTTARDIVAASGTNLASIGYHFGRRKPC